MLTTPNGFSIVVCTYNGASRLEPTLKSIFTQKVASKFEWEVLVIDNASTDGTSEFCIELKKKYNFKNSFRVVPELIPGLSNAKKKGLFESKFNWVLFCDDDNHLFENFLEIGYEILSKNLSIGAIGAMGIPLFISEKPYWFDEYQHSFAVGVQNSSNGKLLSQIPEVYGAGCFIFKPALEKVFTTGFQNIMTGRKGKSMSSGEDVEWCYLIHLLNYEIWFSDELKFHHLMPPDRLRWDYYKKLKSGIASGAALLFPYVFIFENRKNGQLFFIIKYLQLLALYQLIFFRQKIKLIFKSTDKNDQTKELGYNIVKAKAKSYASNFLTSLRHYKAIKLLQEKLNINLDS